MAILDEEKEQIVEHSVKKPTEERGGRGESSFPSNNNNSSGSREEGELTASDNDVNISHLPLYIFMTIDLTPFARKRSSFLLSSMFKL